MSEGYVPGELVLGVDIGITSIGWALRNGDTLMDVGVRIFPRAENPEDGSSLSLPRWLARASRRLTSRKARRLASLKHMICKEFKDEKGENGKPIYTYEDFLNAENKNSPFQQKMYPKKGKGKNKEEINPYYLRNKALKEKLTLDEFVCVILHIAKHRGYCDLNPGDLDDDSQEGDWQNNNAGKEKAVEKRSALVAISSLREEIAKHASAGAYLYSIMQKSNENHGENVRNRAVENKKGEKEPR